MTSISQGFFSGPLSDPASRQSPQQHAAPDWMEAAYGSSDNKCGSLTNQQLLDSLCQTYQQSQQVTPSALQLLPDPFKRSPLQGHSPDGGIRLTAEGGPCTSAFPAGETPQPLVSLSPPQPPQMHWDPPQLPLQLDSTSPLPPAHWPDVLLPAAAAALTALPERQDGLRNLRSEGAAAAGPSLQRMATSPTLFSLLTSPMMAGVNSPAPLFPLMAPSTGLISPPVGSPLLFGTSWSPNIGQVQNPEGSCHGGYMAQQKYPGAGTRECSQTYEAMLAMNFGDGGGGGHGVDFRPSSSSTASEVANFAWGDIGEPSSFAVASFSRCMDKFVANNGYRNSPLSVPAVPPLFVDTPTSPPCLGPAAAPVPAPPLPPPQPHPTSDSGAEQEEEDQQEESDGDALWTAVPRGKRRRGAVGGSFSGSAPFAAPKQARPRVKPLVSEAAASATRAAQAAEAVARRVGRKPGRYDHITVDMLSDNGFLDMPIQEAARHLGIGLSVLKRVCREMGLVRWPFRKRQSINNVMQQTKTFLAEDKQAEVLAALEGQLQTLTGTGETFDTATKCYRQACFKLNHKINKLGKREALNPRAGTARPAPRKPMAISTAAAEKLTLQQGGRSAAASSSSPDESPPHP